MIMHVIHENAETSHIKDLLQHLDTDQLFFIERACRNERSDRKQAVFRQWQQFLKSELAEHHYQK